MYFSLKVLEAFKIPHPLGGKTKFIVLCDWNHRLGTEGKTMQWEYGILLAGQWNCRGVAQRHPSIKLSPGMVSYDIQNECLRSLMITD